MSEAKRLIYELVEQCEAHRHGGQRVQKMTEKLSLFIKNDTVPPNETASSLGRRFFYPDRGDLGEILEEVLREAAGRGVACSHHATW